MTESRFKCLADVYEYIDSLIEDPSKLVRASVDEESDGRDA